MIIEFGEWLFLVDQIVLGRKLTRKRIKLWILLKNGNHFTVCRKYDHNKEFLDDWENTFKYFSR